MLRLPNPDYPPPPFVFEDEYPTPGYREFRVVGPDGRTVGQLRIAATLCSGEDVTYLFALCDRTTAQPDLRLVR